MFYSLAHPQVAELLAVAKALLQEILRSTERNLTHALAAESSADSATVTGHR